MVLQALCNMLVFSGAALPSLHFHEKDPGSVQFLWSQLCKQIPGSTLIGASVSPLPPPGVHQDSTVPRLHSPCSLGMPGGEPELSPTPSHPSLATYQVLDTVLASGCGAIGCLSDQDGPLWIIHTSKYNLCFGLDSEFILASCVP